MNKNKISAITALMLGASVFGVAPNLVKATEEGSSLLVTHEVQGNLDITTYEYIEPINYDFVDQSIPKLSLFAVPIEGKEYQVGTKTIYKKVLGNSY